MSGPTDYGPDSGGRVKVTVTGILKSWIINKRSSVVFDMFTRCKFRQRHRLSLLLFFVMYESCNSNCTGRDIFPLYTTKAYRGVAV